MAISSNGLAGLKPGVVDNTASRPSAPFEGQMIFQKDTDQLLIWNGTAWVIPNSPAQNPTGLEFVKQQTVGSGVSTVTVSDCFNSTYENYEVIYTGGVQSTTQSLNLRLGVSAGNYFNVLMYASWAGGAVSTVGNQNANDWVFMGYGNTSTTWLKVSLFQPFLAKNTFLSSPHAQFSPNVGGYNAGFLNDTTSHTALTISPASGTMTGGTITVYGYRKG